FGDIVRDFGLANASIQAQTLSKEERDNLFWTKSGIGVILAVTLLMLADPLATYFQDPMLASPFQMLSLTFVANGATTQYRASLARALQMNRLFAVDVSSVLAGILAAVALSVYGWGLWALVAQRLVN